ncbi:hypothetical protein AMAG_01242 [Allomyces macrogynus ATCC 38327]|uniref:Uncharacterized protein n=1 Tax=Allomyces macrogynus (strain ATCC 38327) TaxID=578462 RepID=A0A0L0RYV8_ALLM3|nr:hypothetical protein AMAG_01242 [Allomyces macrogynus ATCC 38327]|eukprot:KNE55340.1 hypothetical protein AMAG_01242 [Allomyces macrogynus ATCC 38327]
MSADVSPEKNPFAAASSSSAASPSRRAAKLASPARPSAPTPRSAANGGPIAVPVVEVEVRRPRAALADRLAAPSSPRASPVSPKPSQLPAPGAMAATDFPTFNRATYSPTVSPMRMAAGPSSVSQLVPPSPSKIIATARDVFASKLRNEVQASPQRPGDDDDEPVFEDDDDEDNVSEPDLDRRVNLSKFLLKEDLADEDEQDDDDFRYVGDEDEDEDEEADEEDDVDLTEELDSENEMTPAVLATTADRARSPVPAQPAHFIGWVEQRASTALAARQAKRRPATAAANAVSPAMVALHRFLSVLLPLFVVFFGAYCFFFQRSPWTLDCATLTADAAVVRRSLLVALVELVAAVREQLLQLS